MEFYLVIHAKDKAPIAAESTAFIGAFLLP